MPQPDLPLAPTDWPDRQFVLRDAPQVTPVQVNAPRIAEGRAQLGPQPLPPANDAAPLRHGLTAPPDAGQGLRQMPLAQFIWGAERAQPHPRPRGDHALIVVQTGLLELLIGRQRHLLRGDNLAWLPAGTAFSVHPTEGTRGQVLLLPRHMTDGTMSPTPVMGQPGNGSVRALLHDLDSLRNASLAAALPYHLGLISLHIRDLTPTPSQPAPARDDHQLFSAFCGLARAAMGSGHTISELATQLGCDAARLDRVCLHLRGRRAVEVMNTLRLELGLALLREGRSTPQQIADRLGYTGVAHFARTVVAATGRTPQVYQAEVAPPKSRPSWGRSPFSPRRF
ncbi:MAG: helix-turn-helix domain-containing protein [Paracoccus sp. (in: a-proteobacteria)]|uniref:helix-turn-helix domain-containing protein n=1 Tax=Paracoccus sp. TaxID=267 RepID=UPI0026E01B8D|nr:helix-turn-helix domain-containing protein [Paracoccus sp. (in: a-proteobacteria)]MDO5622401.1 helix-turn-helix domain-containing protein [Paracoccus sp. (in: a-proteobacteria)]